jgi:hypothetical protein
MKRGKLPSPAYKLRRLARDPRSWGEPVTVVDAGDASPGEFCDVELPLDTYIVEDPDAFLARVHADIAKVMEALN